MRIGNHLGISFEIWSGRHAWFWFVADASCNGAAIGAAANEVEAICEAHSSIEEMIERRSSTAEQQRSIKPGVDRDQECGPAGAGAMGWHGLFANPDRFLTQPCYECK